MVSVLQSQVHCFLHLGTHIGLDHWELVKLVVHSSCLGEVDERVAQSCPSQDSRTNKRLKVCLLGQ